MTFYVVTADDYEWFGRCRRAWDLGAAARRGLEPLAGAPATPASALRAALAVHFFPGMWTWNRAVVAPLVDAALERAGGTPELLALLDGFRAWERTAPRITPLRVELELDVLVPDPVERDRGMTTADGAAVSYRDRVPLLLVDEDDRTWLGEHLLVDELQDPDRFRLDERGLLACWAWEETELSGTLAGTQVTEIRLSPPGFRRTHVRRSHRERWGAARRLGLAIREMLAAPRVDPMPAWSHCLRCAFRAPCIAMNAGQDATALLDGNYRPRPRDALGRPKWVSNRPSPF